MTRPTIDGSGDAEGLSDLERLAFFSDAVIAIAITLLVIDLRVPDGVTTDDGLRAALGAMAPRLASFGLSFLVIALWWRGHQRLFRSLGRFDGRLVALNLVMLAGIVFLPFSTSVLGQYGNLSTAVAMYAGANVVVAFAVVAMRMVAVRRSLLGPGVGASEFDRRTRSTAIVGTIFLASIPVAFTSPDAAHVLWYVAIIVVVVLGARQDAAHG